MERCEEHLITDGEVERSKKMDGVVERTRRCSECGARFKTFELTDDQLARQQGKRDMEVRDLKRELDYYKGIVKNVKVLHELELVIRNDVLLQYEYGGEDRD